MPLSVPHMTMKDTVIQGYKIPQGSVVLPNLYSVSHDPTYWTDPETFNPERYFDKARKIVKNDALVPFSVGKCASINIRSGYSPAAVSVKLVNPAANQSLF